MMKYSATILLFVATAFWSSSLAKPYNPEQQGVIDAFTRWAIAEMGQLPEPHKTKLINRLHEAQHQHWDNLMEYMAYVQSVLVRYVRESGVEFSRRKRDVGSDQELSSDDKTLNKIFNGVYAKIFISMAPPTHREALEKKYAKALEKDYEDEDFVDEAVKIFEEETGLDFTKVEAEVEADEEKFADFEKKFIAELINALSEETASSEEE